MNNLPIVCPIGRLMLSTRVQVTSGRAIATSEIIRQERPVPMEQLDSLRELSFGPWEGKTFPENAENDPERESTEQLRRSSDQGRRLKSNKSDEKRLHRKRSLKAIFL